MGFPSFRQHSAAGNPENLRGPGNGFRKRSEHCEIDDFVAFVVFSSFRQLSAAGNPENPRGPGNGFRKRSEHWEMDDFAAFVGFPSFRQLSAAGSPENLRGLELGRRFCCFWESSDFGSFRFGGRKSRKSKGPWKWLSEKERRTLRNGRFCYFCGFPFISAGNIAKRTILLLLSGSPHFGSFRRPEIQKIQRGVRGQKRPGRTTNRPEEARKRPEEAWKRPGRDQEEAGRGQEEARRGPEEAKAPKGQESRIWEKLLETQCFMNRK